MRWLWTFVETISYLSLRGLGFASLPRNTIVSLQAVSKTPLVHIWARREPVSFPFLQWSQISIREVADKEKEKKLQSSLTFAKIPARIVNFNESVKIFFPKSRGRMKRENTSKTGSGSLWSWQSWGEALLLLITILNFLTKSRACELFKLRVTKERKSYSNRVLFCKFYFS